MLLYRDVPPPFVTPPVGSSSPLLPQDPHFPNSHRAPEFTLKLALTSIGYGARCICPNCHKGKLFRSYFSMWEECPVCHVKLDREQGEYVGAMYMNLILTEFVFIVGYFLLNSIVELCAWTQVSIWVLFNLLFVVMFYPRSKGIWSAVLYLCGQLYADPPADGSSAT
jgi:uncharacterized protein (DUF983 family)